MPVAYAYAPTGPQFTILFEELLAFLPIVPRNNKVAFQPRGWTLPHTFSIQ